VPPGVIVFVPVGLIMLQPDLGQSMLFIPALFFVLVAAGARLRHLAIIVVCAAMAAPAAYPFLQPHQQARIVGLLKQVRGDTTTDQDINFQAVTAQTIAGAGGVHGNAEDRTRALVGFNRLPERHNDMVFSVIVNRFGLVGGLAVLGLYAVWLAGAFLAAASTKEPFGRLLIVGCCGFVCAQVFINVGMNVGVVPIIGITLPFVSYGGSSLITMWVMTGLIYNVAVRRPAMLARESLDYADDDD
jgi:rod shape determining protein RodA